MDGSKRWRAQVETVEPGWLLLPVGLDEQTRSAWVNDRTEDLRRMWGKPWEPEEQAAVQALLQAAAQERAVSDATLLFQVWSVPAPIAVMCRIAVLANDGLPPWAEWTGVAHRVEAPHIGPGVQYTHQRSVATENEESIDLFSMAYVFESPEALLVVALQECPALVLNEIRQGFIGLLDSLRLDAPDGASFQSSEPRGILDDGPWDWQDAS